MIANNILEKESSARTHRSSWTVQFSQLIPRQMPDNFNYPWAQFLSLRGTLTALFIVAVSLFELAPVAVAQEHSPADPFSWPTLTRQAKPWTWWWWLGSAVDSSDIARQLRMFQKAGLGGVQIIPIYGVQGWESHNIDFLSPKWMQMMGFTVAEGRRLGMGVDMALESGWCFGGPAITDEYANAFVVQKTYNLLSGERIKDTLSPTATQALMAFGPDGRKVDLLGNIQSNSQVDWTAPSGKWQVYAISQRFSGQKVKRAGPGGQGPMLNPFYAPAMERYLRWFSNAFDHYSGPKARAVFQDSYEYQCNWSPDFFSQFEKLRGYKLQNNLPALFGETPADEIARVKSDYRQTVSDMMVEKSNPIWIDWARRRGFKASYQAHGAPANLLDLYAEADIPETEMFHLDRNPLVSKFASSAAHVAGRPLTAAETCTWLSEHFTETLAEIKYQTDDMFISGVNHIFYHGTCYSPKDAQWPGWLFYASTEMNPRNSIWHDVPTLNGYVSRCQSVLQAGHPDNDILLYWPISDFWNDTSGMVRNMKVGDKTWFENQPIGRTASELWNRGYSFDYVSDNQTSAAKAAGKEIRVPGGRYRVILSPSCHLMPVKTLHRLLDLAHDGATIVFETHLPEDVPGWGHLAERREEFKRLIAQIHLDLVGENVMLARLGRGQILVGDREAALRLAGLKRETMTDHSGLSFIRRSVHGGWYYFIANRNGTDLDGWITLSHPAKSVVLMDPMTGKTGLADVRNENNRTQVYLQLPNGGSVILHLFANRRIKGPHWSYRMINGTSSEIQGNWRVSFVSGGPDIPAPFETEHLASWTARSDTDAQRFAGTARYTISFDAPDHHPGSYLLNLGKVCQSARVTLNGKYLGTLLTPPFNIPISLRSVGNTLVVDVTNVSANRIRDLDRRQVKWKIFHDINFVNIDYKPFNAASWPLYDSGLLGPVTLTPATVSAHIHQ
ncbi:MAG: glycosyl hydrolase [Bacteroidota bacterium]